MLLPIPMVVFLGFIRSFTQTTLSSLIDKRKQIIDNKGYGAAIFMDLSKAFDTINHELLIGWLHAYGFARKSLLIILSYLSDHWEHVKINSSFRSWSKLTQGILQRFVLGHLLLNIFLNDLFFALKDIGICNFVDGTIFFVCDFNTTLNKPEGNSAIALTWFGLKDKYTLHIPLVNTELKGKIQLGVLVWYFVMLFQ